MGAFWVNSADQRCASWARKPNVETCSFDVWPDPDLTSDLFKQNCWCFCWCLVQSFRFQFSGFLRPSVRELDRGQNLPPPPAGRVRPNTPAGRGLSQSPNVKCQHVPNVTIFYYFTWHVTSSVTLRSRFRNKIGKAIKWRFNFESPWSFESHRLVITHTTWYKRCKAIC